jgi:hypothetical protein
MLSFVSEQRDDLVMELRGDWFRVAAMPGQAKSTTLRAVKFMCFFSSLPPSPLAYSGSSDALLRLANENIGQYYFDRQMWAKADEYFQKVQRWDMVARCFVRLERWQELRILAETKIPDTSKELLAYIGLFAADVAFGVCAVVSNLLLMMVQALLSRASALLTTLCFHSSRQGTCL